MNEPRRSESVLVATASAEVAEHSNPQGSGWRGATAIRKRIRHLLRRSQLFWLVHFGSRPHDCGARPTLVIAPHQDDEVLGCGGLIALKRRNQVPVHIVFVTDGSASHDDLDPTCRDPQLVALRRQEAIQAAAILGVEERDVTFLDLPDGKLQLLDAIARQRTIETLIGLLTRVQPQELYVPHRHDRTDDHEEVYRLTLAALRATGLRPDVYQYAVWLLWSCLLFRDFRLDEFKGASRLRINAVRDRKRQALLAHRSQCAPRARGARPVLEPGFVRQFLLPDEVFFRIDDLLTSAADSRRP